MERNTDTNDDLIQSHNENRKSTEAESKREDMQPHVPDTSRKKDGTTSAFSAATGGNTGNDGAKD